DVALGLEDLANLDLLLRRRQRHGLLARRLTVADARQEIGDRISHAHSRSPTSPARLRKPGDLAAHRRLAQLVARQAEAPVVPVRPAADRTTVAQPNGARVARQRLQLRLRRQLLLVRRARIIDDALEL